MSDNDRLRIVILEGSVLELLAINKELVEALEEAVDYYWVTEHYWITDPVMLENMARRARAVIAKAKRGSSPTAPLRQPGE